MWGCRLSCTTSTGTLHGVKCMGDTARRHSRARGYCVGDAATAARGCAWRTPHGDGARGHSSSPGTAQAECLPGMLPADACIRSKAARKAGAPFPPVLPLNAKVFGKKKWFLLLLFSLSYKKLLSVGHAQPCMEPTGPGVTRPHHSQRLSRVQKERSDFYMENGNIQSYNRKR